MEKTIKDLHEKGYSARAIGRELGIDFHKVTEILKSQGFVLKSNRQKAEEFRNSIKWEELIARYEEGSSLTTIAKEHNLTYDVVRANFKRLGVSIRSVRESRNISRVYSHRNVFEPLTSSGAYLLGWILADGSMSSKLSNIKIGLAPSEIEHLTYLRDLFTEVPIQTYSSSVEFVVSSIEIKESLEKLGVKPRKSYDNYDISWELISNDLLPYVVLGLFEGDGSISKTKSDMSMLLPSNLYSSIRELVLDPLGITTENGLIVREVKGNKYGLLNVRFQGLAYYIFGDWLYSSTKDIKPLERKFCRFRDNLHRVVNSKSKFRSVAEQLIGSIEKV